MKIKHVGDIIKTPESMIVESVNEEKQTVVVSWIDEESGLNCKCELPFSALKLITIH